MASKSLEQKIDALTSIVEKGFAAVAGDITDIKRDMATKEQLHSLHTQVNSIERQLRETRTEIRLGNLEEEVFGKARG
jgi:capsule polysaccharide export protein KpsE/RkpR